MNQTCSMYKLDITMAWVSEYTREYNVPFIQSHNGADIANKGWDAENHVTCIAFLS